MSLDEAKEEMNAMERRARELHAYSETFARAEKDMIKTIEFMEEIDQDMRKCKEAKEEVKTQKKQIEENRLKAMECSAQRKRLEKLIEQRRDHFEQYKEDANIKLQAADHALRGAKEELEQLMSTRSEAQKRIEANETSRKEIERQLREEELKFEQEMSEIQQLYSQLDHAISFYNAQVLEAVP